MKPPPADWPRIATALYYDDPARAIDWLCKAFGFEVLIKVEGENGSVVHSELVFGGGLVMVADAKANRPDRPEWGYRKSPRGVGGANTQSLMVYVDDVEAHCNRARAEGAQIVSEPATSDYGEDHWSDRGYEARDLEGHHWWFNQRLRTAAK